MIQVIVKIEVFNIQFILLRMLILEVKILKLLLELHKNFCCVSPHLCKHFSYRSTCPCVLLAPFAIGKLQFFGNFS